MWRNVDELGMLGYDIVVYGLIGLIEYLHQQTTIYFLEIDLQRTMRLIVLTLVQFPDGWPIGKAHEWGQGPKANPKNEITEPVLVKPYAKMSA